VNQGKFIFILLFFSSFQLLAQHRKVQTWYDSLHTIPKEIYYVTIKSPHHIDSLYTSYFQNGKIKSTGIYQKGKPSGLWEYFYENGNPKMSGEIKDNENVGIWSYYYENGKINMMGEVHRGLREGEWKYYYENGNLKSSGTFKKDEKEGSWNYYYEDNTYKAHADFIRDKGKYTEFYSNGEIKSQGEILDGKSNGNWKYFYEEGGLQAEGNEKAGVKDGHWKFYHKNDSLASEGNFVNGKAEGDWKYYHDNGTLSAEGNQKEGEKDGYWKLYYKSGLFKAEGNFKGGDGPYKEYYESGKLKIEGYVKKDKNEGAWKYYYEDGKPEGECFFTNGKGHYTGLYPNGTKKMEGLLDNGNKVGVWKLYKEDGTLAGYYKTYYENDVAVFKPIEDDKDKIKLDSTKKNPAFKAPRKKGRNFTAKINEYQNFILGANPAAIINRRAPVYLEYYFQERLGYEANFTFYRNPFFKSAAGLPVNTESISGFSVYLKQKLYNKDKDNGMIYYAQEARFTLNNYQVLRDSMGITNRLSATERKYEFSLLIGDRLIKNPREKGWTLDIFFGIGVGFREISRAYQKNPKLDAFLPSLHDKRITIPVRFGFSVGYLLGKIKSVKSPSGS
jgi:antitoxin component YwqK of YwqJK toxin-antitoxin module